MTHQRVDQLLFARTELLRGYEGVTDPDAQRRFEPMNCLSWIVGHLAFQEQTYWLARCQGLPVDPQLVEWCGWDQPASTPPIDAVWEKWHQTVAQTESFLTSLDESGLLHYPVVDGRPHRESVGTMIQRVTYHYWFHIGESQAIRQLLNHQPRPDFVGAFPESAIYRPE